MTLENSIRTRISPEWSKDGEGITIEVINAKKFANKIVSAEVHGLNDRSNHWVGSFPIRLDFLGNGYVDFDSGFELGVETSVFVHALHELSVETEEAPSEVLATHYFTKTFISVVNAKTEVNNLDDVMSVHHRLLKQLASTYTWEFGEEDESSKRFRALSIVEGVLVTIPLKLPGISIVPVSDRITLEEQRVLANKVIRELGWSCHLNQENWQSVSKSKNPVCLVIFDTVHAKSHVEAGEIVRPVREQVLDLLTLNRIAKGQSICLVLEEVLDGRVVSSKWVPEGPQYGGNLAGGFLSGEDQSQFYKSWVALAKDPLLALCCELLGDALSQLSPDSKYFRYWSILELLSDYRNTERRVVKLRDGSPWPNSNANTTNYAQPRVYDYLSRTLFHERVNMASMINPASSLLEAVQVWYARRNATAHKGRFIVDDETQQTENWYKHALKSIPEGHFDVWLDVLRHVVISVIQKELSSSSESSDTLEKSKLERDYLQNQELEIQ